MEKERRRATGKGHIILLGKGQSAPTVTIGDRRCIYLRECSCSVHSGENELKGGEKATAGFGEGR